MAATLDGVKFAPTGGGTSDFTYSSAVTGYQSPAAAGVVNGAVYRYRAESADLSQWEIGYGAYNTGTGVLARTTVLFNSSGTTSKINFSATPTVGIVLLKEDLISITEANAFTAAEKLQARTNISAVLRGQIAGLTLSTAGSSSTFSVAAGEAADSTSADLMILGSAISKTTSAWAVGSGNGGLDTGSIANNTWYHAHLIKRSDTGVVDVLVSTSVSSPTLPTNYTYARRIGSMKTNGSAQWIKFYQSGNKFLWDTPVTDSAGATVGTTSVSVNISTPLGVVVEPFGYYFLLRAAAAPFGYIRSPSVADVTPSLSDSKSFTDTTPVAGGITYSTVKGNQLLTGVSSEIYVRADAAGTSFWWSTAGWYDTRGRDN